MTPSLAPAVHAVHVSSLIIKCNSPQVRLAMDIINQDPPATCGKEVVGAVEAAVKELGLSSKHMVSRAYHDSLFMAQVCSNNLYSRLNCLLAFLLHAIKLPLHGARKCAGTCTAPR